MGKTFENYFTDLQADMVSICLEYSGQIAEKIYIYGSIEKNTTSFNVFYQVKGEILHLNELNRVLSSDEQIDDHRNRQFTVLQVGVENLEKIEKLCKECSRDIPTEIKIQYDVGKNSMKAKYKYEPVYSLSNDKTDDDIFNEWFKEIKTMTKRPML